MQILTRELISEKTHRALKRCGLTKTTILPDDNIILAMDSFDWSNLWVHLEGELGVYMNFGPESLINEPNCTPKIIIDFLYRKLMEQEKEKQVKAEAFERKVRAILHKILSPLGFEKRM